MNCETIAEKISLIVAGRLSATELADCKQHIDACADCSDVLRGTEALWLLGRHNPGPAPAGLLEKIVTGLDRRQPRKLAGQGFWLGAGFGGIVAASLVALALSLGWMGPRVTPVAASPEFYVSVGEARTMDIAIDTDRALADANISILLSGGVELDGYDGRRELTWKTDLKPGTNRLSLPIRALDASGGRLVVRLSHPDSEQVFVVDLKTQA